MTGGSAKLAKMRRAECKLPITFSDSLLSVVNMQKFTELGCRNFLKSCLKTRQMVTSQGVVIHQQKSPLFFIAIERYESIHSPSWVVRVLCSFPFFILRRKSEYSYF